MTSPSPNSLAPAQNASVLYGFAIRTAVAMLLLVATAFADDKPTFAIHLRANDFRADKITYAFGDAMRALGKKKTAAYRTRSTYKDLVAATDPECPVLSSAACAAAVGEKLGVDYMFVGEVESRGRNFIVTLSVINVQTKKRVRSARDTTPIAGATAKRLAATMFTRLVADISGELQLSCNCARAVVIIDGQRVTEIFESRATVTGLALGTHSLELRAPGFKPYIDDVTVDGTAKLSVLMTPDN